jgi:ABC-2 type transport system ATP-binding protein
MTVAPAPGATLRDELPDTEAALRATNVKKRYGGKVVLGGVTMHVLRGEVVGIAGLNGAGKTTLLDVIVGLTRPSEGVAVTSGRVALLPEKIGFVEHLNAMRNLRLLSSLRANLPRTQLADLLHRVGLGDVGGKPVGKYSLGMRQRLGLAQALMEEAELLVLDEPTNGLDPTGIAWLRETVRSEAARGAGVVVTSHQLAELESLCDRVLILAGGVIAAQWRRDELRQRTMGARVAVRNPEQLRAVAAAGGWEVEESGESEYLVRPAGDVPALVAALVTGGVLIDSVRPAVVTLEEVLNASQHL